ncbi:uncharacterized protein PRCAT00004895001 [Priceomyces carsonii]|uniref:uncharacterized protein n=1 Tax=Priceomyces carsonii TaxID=28549 RepID=UPI002EDA5816|nr:unnamed protein product [Priceomyces carsonii]
MKRYQYLCILVCSWISIAVGSLNDCQNLIDTIAVANSLLSEKGASNEVLNSFEDAANILERDDTLLGRCDQIKEEMPQFYYKKALIELNLNKESMAILDFNKVILLDPSNEPARKRLLDLYMDEADFDGMKGVITEKDVAIKEKIKIWESSYEKAMSHYKKQEYPECIRELSQVLSLSKSLPKAYIDHYKCADEYFKQGGKLDDEELYKIAIHDLSKLIQLQPIHSLEFYASISEYLLFTENQYEKARIFAKNCLRIDNDYKLCGDLSKFYTKFQTFLKTLENYSITIGHYYLIDQEVKNHPEEADYLFDFKFIQDFLFKEDIKVSKLEKRTIPYGVKTNYDYLVYRATKFLGKDKTIDALKFIQDLNMIACESFIVNRDSKNYKMYCKKVHLDSFFPKFVPEVDKLLHGQKFSEAKKYLDQFNNNVKRSPLFVERHRKVDLHFKKLNQQRERARQQQQQQQHQQRQQQYFRQQQRQRSPSSNQKPLNDYYKILEISRDADDRTIKKAHRTQTLKYHPDKYKGTDMTPDQIENKMQEINQAYEVLSNKELRERYDRGDDPNDPLSGQREQHAHHQQPFNFHSGGGGGGGSQFKFNFGDDFIKQFMGQQGGGSNFQFGGFGGQAQGAKSKRNKNRRRN